MDTTLHVVTCVFNPWRYKSRVRLYHDFEKYVKASGAKLLTIECAFGDRDFEVTQPDRCGEHIQVRTSCELWHKERMLNIAIQRLPSDWKYVAWIDADITFSRPDWVNETVQLLQHYQVIQMFSSAVDTGPNHEHLKTHTGIMYAFASGNMQNATPRYESLHPGFAWAMRRDAYKNLGGLFDTAVLGSADRHMALAMLHKVEASYPHGIGPGYIEQLQLWQDRCKKYIKKNVGYMPGTISHYWHGKKVDRRYQDRWKILVNHQYDPEFDLKLDEYGLYQFTDTKPELEHDIRRYFQARNEDSIDMV